MPLYEYACLKCKMQFDALRSMDQADESIECPSCGGAETRRLISLFSAVGDTGVITGAGSECSSCQPSSSCATCAAKSSN